MVIAAGTIMHSLLLNWMHAPTIRFGCEEWQKGNTITTTWSARLPYLLMGFALTIGLVIIDPAQWLERFFHLSGSMKLMALLAFSWIWLSVETQNFLQLQEAMFALALMPLFIDCIPVIILAVILISSTVLPEYVLIMGLLTFIVLLWSAALFIELRQLKVRWVAPNIEAYRKTFIYAWPLIPGFLLGYISDWGDQLLVRYFFTTHEVGLFQAAYQVMVLLIGVTAPIATIILPRLIDKETISSDAAKKFLTVAGPTLVTLGLFLLVPIVSFAPLCFRILMGSRFTDATQVFIVLCSSIPGTIIAIFYGIFFSLQGRLWRSTVIYGGIMSVLNIAISLILLPRIGILGSAIATSTSYLVIQFLYLLDQHHYYRIPLAKGCILFGAIMAFAMLQPLVSGGLLVRFLLCLFSFIALALLARAYSLLDRSWVLRILSGKLSWLGELVLCVAGPLNRNFNNA